MNLVEFQEVYRRVVEEIEVELETTADVLGKMSETIQDTTIYEDVNKYALSRLYGVAIDKYNGLCARLSRCSIVLIMLRKLKVQLTRITMPVSVCSNCRVKLEGVEKNVIAVRDAIVPLKMAFEAQIKYFNSCQWMLTSDQYADKS